MVDDHIDDIARLAQVLFQRQHIWVDTSEQEAAIASEGAQLLHVVAAFAVEAWRIASIGRLVLDLQQLAAVAERPAMERAGEGGAVALLVAAQDGTAVCTGISQRV